jgi:hypothetical protein
MDVRLHPLVLLSISDHYTRYKAQLGGREPPRVLGCLLGQHTARTVEIRRVIFPQELSSTSLTRRKHVATLSRSHTLAKWEVFLRLT